MQEIYFVSQQMLLEYPRSIFEFIGYVEPTYLNLSFELYNKLFISY
jgi:hypothetical protein